VGKAEGSSQWEWHYATGIAAIGDQPSAISGQPSKANKADVILSCPLRSPDCHRAIGDQVGAATSRSKLDILLLSIINHTQQSRPPVRTKRSKAEFIRSIVHDTDGRAQKAGAELPHMTPVRSAGRAPHLAVSLRDRADMNICGNVTANVGVSYCKSKYVQ
jgi:hypothetical protein